MSAVGGPNATVRARNDAANIISVLIGRQSLELAATAQQRPRPKGRLRQSDRFKVVTYNMAAPSKMQLQLLDTLGYDCIFLPEVWDKAWHSGGRSTAT